MVMTLRNSVDNQRCVAAEEAFTSEGGYLSFENDGTEKHADAGREVRTPPPDFGTMLGSHVERMCGALTLFRRRFKAE